MKESLLEVDRQVVEHYGLLNPNDIREENRQDRVDAQKPARDMEFLKAEVCCFD
jgi:hypothetical protein